MPHPIDASLIVPVRMPLASVFVRQRSAHHVSVPVTARHKSADRAVGPAGSLRETKETGRSGSSKVPYRSVRGLSVSIPNPSAFARFKLARIPEAPFGLTVQAKDIAGARGRGPLWGRFAQDGLFRLRPGRGRMRWLQLIGLAQPRPTRGEGGYRVCGRQYLLGRGTLT